MTKEIVKKEFKKLYPNGISKKEASDILNLMYEGDSRKPELVVAIFLYLFDYYETEQIDRYINERVEGLKKSGYFTAPDFISPFALKVFGDGDIKPWEKDLPGLVEFGEKEFGIGKENIRNIANHRAIMWACIGYAQSVLDGIAEQEEKIENK